MRRHLDAVCAACASGVSIVCMSSMAAALAAAGAAAGAGATGMGAMGGGAAASGAVSALPGLMDGLGLGVLSRLPNEVLQPLLVVLLTLSVGSAYLAYRGHGRPQALILAAGGAVAMYAGIYVWMSDALFLAGLIGMLTASASGIVIARRPRPVAGRPRGSVAATDGSR